MIGLYTTYFKDIDPTNALKDYPIFDPGYRAGLNAKIKAHYAYREIGFEDPAMFFHYLTMRMNEIMPYYNQRYESTLLTIDPFIMSKITDTYTKTNNTTNTQTNNLSSTVSGTSIGNTHNSIDGGDKIEETTAIKIKDVESDTPQALLEMDDIVNNAYASKANINSADNKLTRESTTENTSNSDTSTSLDSTTTNTGTVGNALNGTETYSKTLSGYTGIPESELIQKYRESFLNIDMEIINKLGDLFMGIVEPLHEPLFSRLHILGYVNIYTGYHEFIP